MSHQPLTVLSRGLSKIFTSSRKPRPKADPDYGRFRRLAQQRSMDYSISRDGYIEIKPCTTFPKGLVTAHYGWGETLSRVLHCIETPSAVDKDGSYCE